MQSRILVVDDEEVIRCFCGDALTPIGYAVTSVSSGEEALTLAEQQEFDAVLTDIRMEGMSGLETLRRLKQMPMTRDTPVIIMTGYASMESVIEALRSGAYDYLPKPFDVTALVHTVQRALELTRLRREVRWLREQLVGETERGYGPLVGLSPSMRQLYQTLAQVAPLPTGCVLIMGETGTGKGLVARTLHSLGPRAAAPFVHVNCSAIPADLFESELFGHEPGAFTDARSRRVGRVEAADGGTLFLDEIGDVPLSLQPKLLHVIEDKSVQRLGADQSLKVDVRIIAATNRDLNRMAQEGVFRQDLFYRLNTIPLLVPPLRERPEDIVPLAKHFVELFNREFKKSVRSLSPESERALLSHDWPGNVRELRNVIERAVLFETGAELASEQLLLPQVSSLFAASPRPHDTSVVPATSNPAGFAASFPSPLSRESIEQALAASRGNKSRAAQLLGVSRQTLHKKINEFGIKRTDGWL